MKKLSVLLALVLLVSVASQAAIVTNATHTATLKNDGTTPGSVSGTPEWGVNFITGNMGVDKPIKNRNTVIQGVNQSGDSGKPTLLTLGAVEPTQPFPGYLIGGEQVRVENNNRGLADYQLTITLSQAATVYLLMDNRVNGTNAAAADSEYNDPDIAGWCQWLGSWTRVNTGISKGGWADWVAMDDSSPYDGHSASQFYAIYKKVVPAGNVVLGNQGLGNMYSVVVVPEPATLGILGLGSLALLRRKK